MQNLKKLLAVFCLLVFLSPFVETGVHNYAHANDFHYTAAVHHLHQPEHHCNLCDFTIHVADSPSFTDYHFETGVLKILYFCKSQPDYVLQAKNFGSLRAPPSVV